MTEQSGPIPESGDLETWSLPRVLLGIHGARFEGTLSLSRGRNEKTFRIHKGAPVAAESNLRSETLGVQLIDKGLLTSEQYEQVSDYMRRKQCREGVALLALEILSPKDLFNALKDQVRRRLQEAFAWPGGAFRLEPGEIASEDVQLFRCDPIQLVQEGVESHWGPERILADLTPRMESFPVPRKSFARVRARLHSDDGVEAMLARINGAKNLGQVIGQALSFPRALSAAWVLDAADALEYRSTATSSEDEAPSFDAEIQLNVDTAMIEDANSAKAGHGIAGHQLGPGDSALVEAARETRVLIEKLQSSLDERTHYELLGVESNASSGAIKKAYFKAAKQYHPDTLARLSLSDLREQAAEVFASIAEAFEVLTDKQKRKDYDATLRGELTEAQSRLLAQAETSYRKGEILLRMGDFTGAIEYLKPAVDSWPDECTYQSALGWALYKQSASDPAAGRAHLEKAVLYEPDNATALFRLGMVLRALGESEKAAQALARAKQIDPSID